MSGWRHLRLVLLLGLLVAFGPLAIDLYLPALPRLTEGFGVGASLGSATITGCLIGFIIGQLLVGPISDVVGRRLPIAAGLVVFSIASCICAAAGTIWLLIAARVLQGIGGAAGVVVARAVVRDLYSGVGISRFFSRLTLVSGLAPMAGPLIGSQILRFTTWRGIFLVLAAIGVLALMMELLWLEETLAPECRRPAGWREMASAFSSLLADRRFRGLAISLGMSQGAMFAYIAASSFVLQNLYGVSARTFGLLFGLNAIGIVACNQVSAHFVDRVGSARLFTLGRLVQLAGSLALLGAVLADVGSVVVFLIPLFVAISSGGLILPNVTALALEPHPTLAGSGSAILGVSAFVVGAVMAPLTGVAGKQTALPMACVIAGLAAGALLVTGREAPGRPVELAGGSDAPTVV